jgi:mycofactocin system FadH/OYE family oxidoreductase 2
MPWTPECGLRPPEASMPEFRHLFSPIRIGSRTAKNRIVSTPHATGYAEHGYPTERYFQYYAYKVKGGCGVIMPWGSTSVHPTSPSDDWGGVNNWDDSIIPAYRRISEIAHAEGALVVPQISYRGRRGNSKRDGAALYGPSDIPEDMHGEIPHVMSKVDIRMVIEAYAAAAVRVQRGGCDGVDLCYWGGHIQEQFWSPRANARTDEYGGSLENRMRLAVEVLEAIRDAVGRDFIVGVRLTGDEFLDDGLNHEQLKEIAIRLNRLRMIDYFTISGSTSQTLQALPANVPSMHYPLGVYNYLAASMREVLDVPVIVAGRVVDPVQAEEILATGMADLVAMTRAMIADPELPRKAQEGRLDDIRQCMGANEYCIGRLYVGLPISCVQNPVIGREAELGEIRRADRHKRVVVVGGGPAGLEAARMTALRGHQVVLFERNAELGGQILAAKNAPGRADYEGSVRWLRRQVEKLGVDVRLKTEATLELVLSEQPDAVIVATGSVPRLPNVPGASGPNVVSVNEVLLGRAATGQRCLVVDDDAHLRGPSAAEYLADQGKEVEIVSRLYMIAQEVDDTLRPDLYARLFQKGVTLTPHAILREILPGKARIQHIYSKEERVVEIDTVILALGGQAQDGLYHALEGRVSELHLVGDALAPRRLHDAILDATRVARQV